MQCFLGTRLLVLSSERWRGWTGGGEKGGLSLVNVVLLRMKTIIDSVSVVQTMTPRENIELEQTDLMYLSSFNLM